MRHFTVLLVEDNPDFALLLQEAFGEVHSINDLKVVRDGSELMQFLRQEGEFAGQPRPNMILLDLDLPGKYGLEVLKELKADAEYTAIPVIVLTGSNNPADIKQSYLLGANCFIERPAEFAALTAIVDRLEKFWFSIAQLPGQ